MTIDVNKTYTATIKTAKGDIVIALDAKNAPIAVNNFVFLANQHWYDGTYFWRVEVPGKPSPIDPSGGPSQLSLIQGGSVTDNGQDSADTPGYTIKDDKVSATTLRAQWRWRTLARPTRRARSSSSTSATSRKFFTKTYVIFGNVTSGMDVVKKIQPKDKIESITIAVTSAATPTTSAAATATP